MIDIGKREKRKERYNEVIRAGHAASVDIMGMLKKDLDSAWRSYMRLEADSDKARTTRGRIRGLAQALATVQNPYSRLEYSDGTWTKIVLQIEKESMLRMRRGQRAAG